MGVKAAKNKGTDRIPNLEKRIVESAVRENYNRFKNRAGGRLCGFYYGNSYYLIRNNSIESCRPVYRVPIEKNEAYTKRLERVFGDEKL